MSLQRAIDRFLPELREAEEGETVVQAQSFSDNRNPNPLSNLVVDEASSSNTIPQPDNIRGLTEKMERVERVEREVPRLVRRSVAFRGVWPLLRWREIGCRRK